MSVLYEMRRTFREHIRSCGLSRGQSPAECNDEIYFAIDEVFTDNVDISFNDFPNITVFHTCCWVDCDWTQERIIRMIEQPPEGQQTLHEFVA